MKKPVKKKKLNPRMNLDNWDLEDYRADVADFPGCCGLKIIRYLPYRDEEHSKDVRGLYLDPYDGGIGEIEETPPSVVKKFIEEDIKKILKGRSSGKEGYIITLNSLQIPKLQSVLYKCGFKRILKPFLHKGHGRKIAIYFHPPKNGKKVKKSFFG